MSLSGAGADGSGAGGKGFAQSINGSRTLAIKMTYSDGSVELMTDFP